MSIESSFHRFDSSSAIKHRLLELRVLPLPHSMRRSRFPLQVFADASITTAPFTAMTSRGPYRGGRGRGRGGRSYSDRPYNNTGSDQFVTGDSHFQSVYDANLGFRHGHRGSSSNLDPRRFGNGEQPRRQPQPPLLGQRQQPFHQPRFDQNNGQRHQPPPLGHRQQPFHQPRFDQNNGQRPPPPPLGQQQQPFYQPRFDQNNGLRPLPPRGQWQQFHQPNPSPWQQSYAACPPPPFYQNQMSRPPPQHQRPRSKPSDFREWEYAKTPPSPGSEKFVVLSYNILADYLANDHWRSLYVHIPRHILSWGRRKNNIVFELGLWSADIMCLQEVDRFQDLEEELKPRGYSGIWKMRTGNAVDGCAIFWRANRFKLVHEESIQFNQLGLRDNVAQICVLEKLLNSHPKENELPPSESCSRRVVICNIHVLFNPKRGDFKLGQVRTLLERAHAVSTLWDDAPVVLCGDFNCTPKSHLYNFILERKLELSGLARDKVSGQDSAVIRPSRPENNMKRFQPENKSPQGQVQPQDSTANTHMDTKSNINVGEVPSGNTSELPCGDTVPTGQEATSSCEQVLTGEDPSSDFNLRRENKKPDDSGDLSIAEVLSSVTILDPKSPHAFEAKEDLGEKVSASSALPATDHHSAEEIVSTAQNIPSSISASDDILTEITLDEAVVFAEDKEGIGEDEETFLAELQNSDGQNEELVNELSRQSDSEAFDGVKITYNPSSWTPMEIATATGDPERSRVEHAMELKSTYSEIEGKANTRDENGEPVVTSYHRCFMGTVDYIWRSEGLETVRVLAPMPKQAMQWTPGFPTPKWGSDHIALVSELAFCSSNSKSPPPKS